MSKVFLWLTLTELCNPETWVTGVQAVARGADGARQPSIKLTGDSRQPGQDQQKPSGHLDLQAGDLGMVGDLMCRQIFGDAMLSMRRVLVRPGEVLGES